MPTMIRLRRMGKTHYPTYRIVAVDKRKKRDGEYIEKLGHYNPMQNPVIFEINEERYDYWVSRGAQLSEGMRKLALYKMKEKKQEKATNKESSLAGKKEKISTKQAKKTSEKFTSEKKEELKTKSAKDPALNKKT